jgi:hypothetical protein
MQLKELEPPLFVTNYLIEGLTVRLD